MTNLVFPQHTIEKLDALNYYYNLWFYIVKRQKCYIIECNSGTGYVEIRNQKDKALGSSLLALNLFKNNVKENLTLFLIEKEKKNFNQLKDNITEYIQNNDIQAQIDEDIIFYNSDWSSVIEDIIGKTCDGIRLFFLDPYAIKSLPWNMLSALIKKGKSEFGYKEAGIEILINWAWHAIRRKIGKYYNYKKNKLKNKDLSVPKEIQILDDFFGPTNWKKIVNEFPYDIFRNEKIDKIKELRDKLLMAYVTDFFSYFRYVKIHPVYSRKKGKQKNLTVRGRVKYFLIFATNYQPALKIIDKKFKEYRDQKFFFSLPNTQKNLSKFIPPQVKEIKIKKKDKIQIDDKIKDLENEIGMNLYNKSKDIIKYLYGRKHYDYGAFAFALFNEFEIDENTYIPFLIENKIIGIRRKKSWKGYEGDYYFLCHLRIVDRRDFLFFNEKRYLFKNGIFLEF